MPNELVDPNSYDSSDPSMRQEEEKKSPSFLRATAEGREILTRDALDSISSRYARRYVHLTDARTTVCLKELSGYEAEAWAAVVASTDGTSVTHLRADLARRSIIDPASAECIFESAEKLNRAMTNRDIERVFRAAQELNSLDESFPSTEGNVGSGETSDG